MDWTNARMYRKKQSRYKAIQYEDGDWVVKDLLTDKVFVLSDDVFDLIFEES